MNCRIQYVKNKKGGLNLLKDGYAYTKNKCNNDGSTLWRCSNRKKCSASLKLSKDNVVDAIKEHSCSPNKATNKIAVITDKAKKEVCQNFGPIPKILEKVVLSERNSRSNEDAKSNSSTDEEVNEASLYKTKKDSLYRARKAFLEIKTGSVNAVPNIIAENFLVCDDDGEVDSKILIFSTKTAQRTLKSFEGTDAEFYGDGTFKCVPSGFYQLYSIHLNINTGNNDTVNIVPIIFCLLPDKSQQTYIRLFHLIKTHLEINFRRFKCDYEIAQVQALQAVFSEIVISGCYYHYSKAVWKKAAKLGVLATRAGSKKTEICANLPLLPTLHISEVWQEIRLLGYENDTETAEKFNDYMDKQWLGKLHDMISCASEIHRTNNSLEGWHRRLNARMKGKRTFIHFLFKLKKEAQWQCLKLKQTLFEGNARRRVDVIFNAKYKKELEKLQNNEITGVYFIKNLSKIKKELLTIYRA